jgi:Arc/MetJ-type ribon-helix-helix transcriptional regulator
MPPHTDQAARLLALAKRDTTSFRALASHPEVDVSATGFFAGGEYASESEVIRDGLRALMARDRAVERWLVQEVGPAYDALNANPERGVSADQVRERLAARHKLATSSV